MKRLTVLLALFAAATLAFGQWQLLTNTDILQLMRDGVPDERIIRLIESVPAVRFDAATPGISKPVQEAMAARVARGAPLPPARERLPQKPRVDRSGWGLKPGRVELSGFAGANAGSHRPSTVQWSRGLEIRTGIGGPVAAWGSYAYNRIYAETNGSVSGTAGFHEGLVGVVLAMHTRVAPYVAAGVGVAGARGEVYESLSGLLVRVPLSTHLAETIGGGVDIGFAPKVGTRFDVRYVHPEGSLRSYTRATFGAYLRF